MIVGIAFGVVAIVIGLLIASLAIYAKDKPPGL
jgi:hypothetical protein